MHDIITRIKANNYSTSFSDDGALAELFRRDNLVMDKVREGLAPAIRYAIHTSCLSIERVKNAIREYEAIRSAAHTEVTKEPEIIRRARDEEVLDSWSEDAELLKVILSDPKIRDYIRINGSPPALWLAIEQILKNSNGLTRGETIALMAEYDRIRGDASRAEEIRAEIARLSRELKGLSLW